MAERIQFAPKWFFVQFLTKVTCKRGENFSAATRIFPKFVSGRNLNILAISYGLQSEQFIDRKLYILGCKLPTAYKWGYHVLCCYLPGTVTKRRQTISRSYNHVAALGTRLTETKVRWLFSTRRGAWLSTQGHSPYRIKFMGNTNQNIHLVFNFCFTPSKLVQKNRL